MKKYYLNEELSFVIVDDELLELVRNRKILRDMGDDAPIDLIKQLDAEYIKAIQLIRIVNEMNNVMSLDTCIAQHEETGEEVEAVNVYVFDYILPTATDNIWTTVLYDEEKNLLYIEVEDEN